jgi:hypothetical protein
MKSWSAFIGFRGQALPHDVVIVGCGPAGIFSTLELAEACNLSVLMLDKGPDITERRCPASRGLGCVNCNPCSLLCGWGGAGAFSDGKLTLSTEVGGWLNEYVGTEKLLKEIDHVDETYLRFGAPTRLYGVDADNIEEIERKAALAGLKLIPERLRHLGTEKCAQVLREMKNSLQERVEIRTNVEVKALLTDQGRVVGVETGSGEKISSRYVIVAPGRVGAEWLASEAQTLGLKTLSNPVDVGVRVEVPAPVTAELTDILYEPKFIYFSKSFDDRVRTFCFNPSGEIITESYNGVVTVNGQSYAEKKTQNTNFAILVSTSFTEPFKEPIAYGKYLARLANLLSGGIIVQRLGDLEAGRRSTSERIERNLVRPTLSSATPGDLSFVLPYRYLSDIREMLHALDLVSPGICSKHTLLYGVEVKFYSSRLELTENLETKIRNLFAIGDGAGVTRGLVQASVSGVIVAQEILRRESARTR